MKTVASSLAIGSENAKIFIILNAVFSMIMSINHMQHLSMDRFKTLWSSLVYRSAEFVILDNLRHFKQLEESEDFYVWDDMWQTVYTAHAVFGGVLTTILCWLNYRPCRG